MMNKLAIFDFDALVVAIRQAHEHMAAQAGRAINISLTLRNWFIGAYIAEYELRGMDRATYGDNLLIEFANSLTTVRISNCNRRQLYRYLRFYRLYPSIVGTLSPQLKELLPAKMQAIGKAGTLSPQLHFPPEQGVAMLSSQEVMILTSQNAISRSGHRR